MDDLAACLRLTLTQGIGPVSALKVIKHFPDISAISHANGAELEQAGLSKAQAEAFIRNDSKKAIERAFAWLEKENHHILVRGTRQYPARLADIHDAPLLLYVIGDTDVLHTPQLAIVGSRKPTPGGVRTAFEFARDLAFQGLTITSGLALGIDAEAHKGCLAANGLTVAVAATGLDRVYPAKHRDLAYEIVKEGAMLSEFPLGTPVRAPNFTRRNRLISGLALGTLVVEAAVRSGSLTTAKHATEQSREVLAIPGSIHNPLARGCHRLIRQGAKLVETSYDVLEELADQIGSLDFPQSNLQNVSVSNSSHVAAIDCELDSDYLRLLDLLDYHPLGIDELVERSGMPAQEVASMLLLLEMQGYISAAGANRYMRN